MSRMVIEFKGGRRRLTSSLSRLAMSNVLTVSDRRLNVTCALSSLGLNR